MPQLLNATKFLRAKLANRQQAVDYLYSPMEIQEVRHWNSPRFLHFTSIAPQIMSFRQIHTKNQFEDAEIVFGFYPYYNHNNLTLNILAFALPLKKV